MSKEIEIKIFEIDKDLVEQSLRNIGAKKQYEEELDNRYFDTGNNSKKYLRIRKRGKQIKVTYKNLIKEDNMQVNDEFETTIGDAQEMKSILESLGFSHYETRKKLRISYIYNDIVFDFDKYDTVPRFMEIEAPSKDQVKERVKKLGLSHHPSGSHIYSDFGSDYDDFIKRLKQEQGL